MRLVCAVGIAEGSAQCRAPQKRFPTYVAGLQGRSPEKRFPTPLHVQ